MVGGCKKGEVKMVDLRLVERRAKERGFNDCVVYAKVDRLNRVSFSNAPKEGWYKVEWGKVTGRV